MRDEACSYLLMLHCMHARSPITRSADVEFIIDRLS